MPFTERHLTVPGPIDLDGRTLKRYHVGIDPGPLDPGVEEAAYAFLPRLLPPIDETPPAGFVVLHQGRSAAYLNAYTWVWDNVIECRSATAGEPSIGSPDTVWTRFGELPRPWIGCVWELPPLEHERSAWVRHVLSPAAPDLAAYLTDTLPGGPIGGPR